MNIKEVLVERTNDDKTFDKNGKNWLVSFRFTNNRKFGVELKPEMGLSEIVVELVKFANLIVMRADE